MGVVDGDVGDDRAQRDSFMARDPDHIADVFGRMYVGNRLRMDRIVRDAGVVMSSVASAELATGCVDARGVEYAIDLDPFDCLMALVVDRGGFKTSTAGGEVRVAAGDGFCQPLGAGQHSNVRGVVTRSVTVPMHHVHHSADELTGRVGQRFWLQGGAPVSAAAGRYWRSVVGMAHGSLMDCDSPVSSSWLLRDQLARMVAAAALSTFPNSTMVQDDVPGTSHVAPATIRRAAVYIEQNVDHPLSVSEIAMQSRISVRALQQGFHKHYGTTPMGYVRRVRLDQVHRELLQADPTVGATVRDAALRWGFSPTSRFIQAYRDAFGELPSQTLRR